MVQPRDQGLLRGLAPAAFEAWVGDRFRELGYEVRATPYQGDHGADLLATRAGETVVVQCKHHPAGTVGEPVLRDLFGTLHHFGATRAILVTTGRVTPAAREWVRDKPLEAWDADDLRQRWAPEIARTAADMAAAVPAVAPSGGAAGAGARTAGGGAWYVYTVGLNESRGVGVTTGARYAVRLPRSVGDHPALGFEPLTDPDLPILPATARMRLAVLSKKTAVEGVRRRTIPVGTDAALKALRSIDLVGRDGATATWTCYGHTEETVHAADKRARETGGASRRAMDREWRAKLAAGG
jgi:hypothetical protein